MSVPAELYDDYIWVFRKTIEKALKPYAPGPSYAEEAADPVRTMAAEFLKTRNDMYGMWRGRVELTPDLCALTYSMYGAKRFQGKEYKYTLTRTSPSEPWVLVKGSYYLTPCSRSWRPRHRGTRCGGPPSAALREGILPCSVQTSR